MDKRDGNRLIEVKTTTVAPAPLTNKWPTKLTRTVLLGLGIHNNYDLTLVGEPIIGWRTTGARTVISPSWLLGIKGKKFKDAAWYDYGALVLHADEPRAEADQAPRSHLQGRRTGPVRPSPVGQGPMG